MPEPLQLPEGLLDQCRAAGVRSLKMSATEIEVVFSDRAPAIAGPPPWLADRLGQMRTPPAEPLDPDENIPLPPGILNGEPMCLGNPGCGHSFLDHTERGCKFGCPMPMCLPRKPQTPDEARQAREAEQRQRAGIPVAAAPIQSPTDTVAG